MNPLRIVQGGIDNGDKSFIDRAAVDGGSADTWVAPKDSEPGDDAVIYIGGFGFYATATVTSRATPRDDWPNRYGATLSSFKLISPAISLAAIRRHVPELTWANYPRSITTPEPHVATKVGQLIRQRRKTGLPDLDDDALNDANIDELRRVAVMRSRSSAPAKARETIYRARSLAIKRYVILRSKGVCEWCEYEAPFRKPDRSPYLEPHHTTQVADDGPDHPAHVIALCPNCHRRAHHSEDAEEFTEELKALLREIESN